MAASRQRSGVAMLEAMIALLIFGLVITAFLRVTQAVLLVERRTVKAEDEMALANELMNKAVLWPEVDLTRRFGKRPEGQFDLYVDRIAPSLYAIVISQPSGRDLLKTVVYRPSNERSQ